MVVQKLFFGGYYSSSYVCTSGCFVQISRGQLSFVLFLCGHKVGA